MSDSVQEILKGPRPHINHNSIRVYDERNRFLYIYGGTRWPNNENVDSPTNRPTSDFFCFNFNSVPSWRDDTVSMREDEAFISPFDDKLVRPEKSGLDLPKLGALPVLQDPIGTIVHDHTSTRTSYLLILGDPVGKAFENVKHPLLLCINLRLNTWRLIKLKNNNKVPDGRARASMTVTGELRNNASDMFLCVFGGVREEIENPSSIHYLETFAVANLSKGVWTIPNGKVPDAIGLLGMYPGLAKFKAADGDREHVLILKGAVGLRQAEENSENAKASFSKAYLFNPYSRLNQFSELEDEIYFRCPRPSRSFCLQPSQARTKTCREYFFIQCGDQRRLNEFPPRPNKPGYRERLETLYFTPEVKIWVAEIRDLDNEPTQRMGDQQARHDGPRSASESSSEDDESSDSSSDVVAAPKSSRLKPSGVLAQKAKRSGPQLCRKSGKAILWRNMTSGRIKQSLENLSPSFRIEAMFLSGDLSARYEPYDYSATHPLSPKLVLIGSDHEYLGEIRADLYNAIGEISLRFLLEADDDEYEHLSSEDDWVIPARPTPDDDDDDEMLLSEEREQDVPGPIENELAVESAAEYTKYTMSPSEPENAIVFDANLDPALVRQSRDEDLYLIRPAPELFEALANNVLDNQTDDWPMESEDIEVAPIHSPIWVMS